MVCGWTFDVQVHGSDVVFGRSDGEFVNQYLPWSITNWLQFRGV